MPEEEALNRALPSSPQAFSHPIPTEEWEPNSTSPTDPWTTLGFGRKEY